MFCVLFVLVALIPPYRVGDASGSWATKGSSSLGRLWHVKDTMEQRYDIVIVGAGAAGLSAAIFAAEAAREKNASPSIVVLDSARKIGAKILVSGGGRCNVTHDEIHPEDYYGSHNIVRNILAAFNEKATVRWFASLGFC